MANRHATTTRERRAVVPLSLDAARQRRADDRHTRDLMLAIAAPCGRRPHYVFNAIASEAHFDRGVRPWSHLLEPIEAVRDELLRRGASAGQLRACREAAVKFFDDMLERFDAGFPAHVRDQVTGEPVLPIHEAYRDLTKEKAEALVANADAVAHPDDRVAAERAGKETTDVAIAARRFYVAVMQRFRTGGTARGVLVVR